MSAPNVAAAELWLRELARTGDPERSAQLVRELTRELATLETWLERGWKWFERNREIHGTPEFMRREDQWMERLGLYERVFEAIGATCERAA